MSENLSRDRNRAFIIAGLGVALLIAIFLSPFASSNPDGLDRVSQDLKFGHKASKDTPARQLPFAQVFNEYALKGVPQAVATPLAGLIGTLATFGLALAIGKLVVRGSESSSRESDASLSSAPSDERLD
ncbi:MAG TPA: PDGLE domain-containing protein [Allocoleopsis sp.]